MRGGVCEGPCPSPTNANLSRGHKIRPGHAPVPPALQLFSVPSTKLAFTSVPERRKRTNAWVGLL